MLGTLELRPLPFKCDMAGPIKALPYVLYNVEFGRPASKGVGIYTRNPKLGSPFGVGCG